MSIEATIKSQLYQLCHDHIDQRISTAEAAMKAAEKATREETKSSVGDKYETGRAMMQMETEKHKTQWLKALHQKKVLSQIKPDIPCEVVKPGSLIHASNGWFYIAIAIGKLPYEGQLYYVVSAESPIAKALRGAQAGETRSFNQQSIHIHTIQ